VSTFAAEIDALADRAIASAPNRTTEDLRHVVRALTKFKQGVNAEIARRYAAKPGPKDSPERP
jgi:hypothetical protein